MLFPSLLGQKWMQQCNSKFRLNKKSQSNTLATMTWGVLFLNIYTYKFFYLVIYVCLSLWYLSILWDSESGWRSEQVWETGSCPCSKSPLYKCCILWWDYNSNTIHIQTQADLFQIRMGLLVSGFGPWRHKERHTILKSLCKPYYADHSMLTPTPMCGAFCDV